MFSLEPHFFDIFGFMGFVYIVVISSMFLKKKTPPRWMVVVLFLIGAIGMIVDGIIVYKYYLS